MKPLHRYLFTALAALSLACLTSCADDIAVPDDPTAPRDGYITLTVSSGNITTRATEPGVDALNENLIQTVTLCLWPSAGDNVVGKPVYMQTFRNLNATGSAVLHIPLTGELITSLFGHDSSGECLAYAAVNVEPGTSVTVEQLRSLAITSQFDDVKTQPSFAMDGDGKVTLSSTGTAATGSITVIRSAAKITLALDVDSSIEETTEEGTVTWTPNLNGMSVWLVKGVRYSTLVPSPAIEMDEEVYFDTPDKLNYDFGKVDAERFVYQQRTPFYTYPNMWSDSPSETHRTYMVLSVPWTPDGGTTYRTCYYQVPVVPLNAYQTVRNISYHINLHVGILGSFVPEVPLEVEADYWVAEWGTEDMNVEIGDYRYLVVDQNDFTVNNQSSITIPFYTSHDTEVVDVKMTFYRYNFSDQGTEFAVTVTDEMNTESLAKGGKRVFTANFDNDNNQLVITHDLKMWQPYNAAGQPVDLTNNVDVLGASRKKTQTQAEVDAVLRNISYFREIDDDEFSRVEFEVTVQHTDVADGTSGIDKGLYKETVTITQYPGIYIRTVQNYAGLLGIARASGVWGNTIINGRTDNNTVGHVPATGGVRPNYNSTTVVQDGPQMRINANGNNWSYSLGLSTSYLNWNPNLYEITITQLSQELGEQYVIGDPRSDNVNNDLSNTSTGVNIAGEYANTLWGNGQTARYYTWSSEKVNGQTVWYQTNSLLSVERGFINAPALYGGPTRRLQYYYPTLEDQSTENMIAPKFRICSSYGGTSAYLTREMARRRAAAYQELGYSAGRWRLPTFGEVRFVMELSRQNKIPRLFGQDDGVWYYWCAQGAVLVPARGDKTTEIRIVDFPGQNGNPDGGYGAAESPFVGNNYPDHSRFVYDEWYWGSTTLTPSSSTPNGNSTIYTFTWGDRPKTPTAPTE